MEIILNTIENKAKFFAQYWGQAVFKVLPNSKYRIKSHFGDLNEDDYLLLKSLSSIKDEDAAHIQYGATAEEFKNFYRNDFGIAILNQKIQDIDYLRSKGYALPYMGLSVEKQVEYGWVKLTD